MVVMIWWLWCGSNWLLSMSYDNIIMKFRTKEEKKKKRNQTPINGLVKKVSWDVIRKVI